MPNPNPQPAPESEPFVYGRDFQFSDLDLEYLEAVHQLQALSIAFGRVGDEAYQAAIAKGMQADGHPAATLWESLRLFNSLLLHAASPTRTEESMKTLLAAMDIASESYSSEEFAQHLDRIRQTLSSVVEQATKARYVHRAPELGGAMETAQPSPLTPAYPWGGPEDLPGASPADYQVGVDFTADNPHPKITVWRPGPDGQEVADVPMATPEDLERLKKEVPLTEAQVDQLARKIARQMLKDTISDKRQRHRLKTNKAQKLARRRNR